MPVFQGLSAWMAKVARQQIDGTRFALLLSEAGFKDITPYQPSDTRRKKETDSDNGLNDYAHLSFQPVGHEKPLAVDWRLDSFPWCVNPALIVHRH